MKYILILFILLDVSAFGQDSWLEKNKRGLEMQDSIAFANSSKGKLDSIKMAKFDYEDGIRLASRDPKRAIESFTRAIQLCDDDNNEMVLGAYAMRALCAIEINDFARAHADASKVISMSKFPIHAVIFHRSLLQEVIDSNLKRAYTARGVANQSLGHLLEACKDWEAALKMGDTNANEYLMQYCK
jgi:tetratricopeptide (TPR) repeat protein